MWGRERLRNLRLPFRKETQKPPFEQVDISGRQTEILAPSNVVHLIDGQGTYSPGLAKELYARFPYYFDAASEVSGKDIVGLALNGNAEELTRTENAQLVTSAYALSCMEALRIEHPDMRPKMIAAKSLGFNIAAFDAGVFGDKRDPESLRKFFEFIDLRSVFMQRDSDRVASTLVNVSVQDPSEWAYVENRMQTHHAETAFNVSETRRRLGGKTHDMEELVADLKENKIRAGIMKGVNGAFHTSLYSWSQDRIANYLENLILKDPEIPLVSNTSENGRARLLTTSGQVKEEMIKIITEPVDEAAMMNYLEAEGYDAIYKIGQTKTFDTDGVDAVEVFTNAVGSSGHFAKDHKLATGVIVAGAAAAAAIAWKITRPKN